jgi:hypothetical protein
MVMTGNGAVEAFSFLPHTQFHQVLMGRERFPILWAQNILKARKT